MFEQYDDVVTVEQLAKMLKIGRNTAYELVRSGLVPSVKIGRQIRVTKRAVIDYLSRTEIIRYV
jgi:excisionase family DNA binding protein